MNTHPLITVFTPSYNRGEKLKRLFDSLYKQSNQNFEWIIVDDGSTDNTKDCVQSFIQQKPAFKIYYTYTENGGKHRAINKGVNLANGILFFIVDSDDWLPSDSINTIATYYNTIKYKSTICGIAGLRGNKNNLISGTTFTGEYLDATSIERNKYGISGEKAEVFITEVLKRYPFPEFEGENFLSEAVVWNKIAFDKLQLRWINKIIYYHEYLTDGLTYNLRKLYAKNPLGYMHYVYHESIYHKWNYLRKCVMFGKVLYTLQNSNVSASVVRKTLHIRRHEHLLFTLIYNIYKLLKKS